MDWSTKDPPNASNINKNDNFITIIFDLCNPKNSEIGFTVLSSLILRGGASMSGPKE